MKTTGLTRKLDTMGRIMLPKNIRSQLGFEEGEEYEFFILEEDGRTFLGIECPGINQAAFEEAKRIVEKYSAKYNT